MSSSTGINTRWPPTPQNDSADSFQLYKYADTSAPRQRRPLPSHVRRHSKGNPAVQVDRNRGVLWDPGGSNSTAPPSMVGVRPHSAHEAVFPYKVPGASPGLGAGTGGVVPPGCGNHSELLLWDVSNSTVWNCSLGSTTASNSTFDLSAIYRTHPSLGVLLSLFALITVMGNVLVMIAIARERYLRTVTNYFIVSLAIADTIIGALVMPFNIVLEMTEQTWYFGADWCDVWHSFDVLASTASILNLSVISLDRYWAITDPIAYPRKMSTGRAFVLIALVWICSAAISFPAILWWRLVAHEDPPRADVCAFTEDSGYLIFSSIVSFYIPMLVILFAYYKIYVAAAEQTRSLRAGAKVMTTSGENGQVMTLRMHRGGGGGGARKFADDHIHYSRAAANSDSDTDSPSHTARGGVGTGNGDEEGDVRPSRMISRKWKHFALSRKLSKLAKEQKAAKTLGIVMGVFCICWVPFFVTNVLFGICYVRCVPHSHIVFPIFTWLGYINSGMNPIIYACSMRDFRRAFAKILLCCCPRRMHIRTRTCRRNYGRGSFSSSNVIVTCGERCSNMVL